MANTTNISPVISPDILKTVSSATAIKSFGDQLKDKAKEKVISVAKNKVGDLNNKINKLIQDQVDAGIEYGKNVEQIEFNYKQYPTEELYQKALDVEKTSYETKKSAFQLEIDQTTLDIQNINNNPSDKIKNAQKSFKIRIKNLKRKTQSSETKSKRDLIKQIVANATKTLAPIIALQLANQFTSIISQRKKLEDLVDQVNNYIDTQVKDAQTVTIATNLRNNAITLINNSIKKLDKLEKTLELITGIVTIFNIILPLLNPIAAIPVITTIPGAPIPGIIPHDKIRDKRVSLKELVSALNIVLSVFTIMLVNEVNDLQELKDRLKEISLKLDGKTLTDLNEQEFTDLTTSLLNGGGQFPMYKGFKFAIKEEQNQAFVVKGNKRHYAVAIDRYGVEIIKSDYSFTQDPNDLIEQLKLTIDQQNLQG
jgi:hypothetical protein